MRGSWLAVALAVALGCARGEAPREAAPDGAAVFAEKCGVCHALPVLGSLREQNRGRPPGFVYDALTHGNMRRIGGELDDASRRAVAEYFTGVSFASPAAGRSFEVSPRCDAERGRFDWTEPAYPSWGGSERNLRALPEGPGLARREISRLAVAWVVAFPEASQLRSQPTAAGGALFVGSHDGSVYALEQRSGCTRWRFKAATEVRTAVTIERPPRDGASPGARAYFGDRAANVYALDAETGALLWKRSVDPHPNAAITGSITVHAGRLIVPVSSNDDVMAMDPKRPCCTHSGAVVALDAASGGLLWRTPTIAEAPRVTGRNAVGTELWGPSGASVWNTPTVDAGRGLVFVGAGNNHSHPTTPTSDAILALELATGRIRWIYQAQAGDAWNGACAFGNRASCPDPEGPDVDFGGGATVLVASGGRELLLAGQKAGVVHALDPATGALQWKRAIAPGGAEGGVRYGMAARGGVAFVPGMVPGDPDGRARASLPGVSALAVNDGALLWRSSGEALCAGRDPCVGIVGAPPLAAPEALFAAGVDGTVYALDPATGEPFWRFDSARRFTTLLGRETRGGGIQGAGGLLLANGLLYVSSGYGQAERPGNALIALAPE
jgi:polyvinyl alcohol dehydrogenase (cytochrome)